MIKRNSALGTIFLIIFILPLTYISIKFFMNELNYIFESINLKILNFNIVNGAVIALIQFLYVYGR